MYFSGTCLDTPSTSVTCIEIQYFFKKIEFLIETIIQSFCTVLARIGASRNSCKVFVETGIPLFDPGGRARYGTPVGKEKAMTGATNEIAGAALDAILRKTLPQIRFYRTGDSFLIIFIVVQSFCPGLIRNSFIYCLPGSITGFDHFLPGIFE